MNGARLILSLVLAAFPAAALTAVRRTRRPRTWAVVIAASLGASFVLFEISLIHASLPLIFGGIGLHALSEACRKLGGHLFGGTPIFGAVAGVSAVLIAVNAQRGLTRTLRATSKLRETLGYGSGGAVGGLKAVFLPMGRTWAVALPGASPQVVLSTSLRGKLETGELDAVARHEAAHLQHHHARFLLLGAAVTGGLRFLPWMRRAMTSLRLALERWADEVASEKSQTDRESVRSALRKLASMTPSAMAGYRLDALETVREGHTTHEWGWSTAATAMVPLALGLTVSLVIHISQLVAMTAGG